MRTGTIIKTEVVRADKATPEGWAMTSLVIAIAAVMVWAFLCGIVGDVAERRGHSGLRWFFLSFFCSPLIGYFVVELLPSAADLTPVGYAPCPYCSRTVKVGREICPYCNADLTGKGKAVKRAA